MAVAGIVASLRLPPRRHWGSNGLLLLALGLSSLIVCCGPERSSEIQTKRAGITYKRSTMPFRSNARSPGSLRISKSFQDSRIDRRIHSQSRHTLSSDEKSTIQSPFTRMHPGQNVFIASNVSDVRELLADERTLDNKEAFDPLKCTLGVSRLMIGTVSTLGNSTRNGYSIAEGQRVLYVKMPGRVREFSFNQTEGCLESKNNVHALLTEMDVLATVPNASWNPKNLEEIKPLGPRALVRLPGPSYFGADNQIQLKRADRLIWSSIVKLGSGAGPAMDFALSPGDQVHAMRRRILRFLPMETENGSVTYGLLPLDAIGAQRFGSGGLKVPLGDGLLVEPVRKIPSQEITLIPKAVPAMMIGRVAMLGSGRLADGSIYEFQFKVGDWVVYEGRASKQIFWSGTATQGEPGENLGRLSFHLVKDTRIKAKVDPDHFGGIDRLSTVKNLLPAPGQLLVKFKSHQILPGLGLQGSQHPPAVAELIRMGPRRRFPPAPRPSAEIWMYNWKVLRGISTRPPLRRWIDDWKIRTKENITSSVLSARRWIARWKARRAREEALALNIYDGLNVSDGLLIDLRPIPPKLLLRTEDDEEIAHALIPPSLVLGKAELARVDRV